MSSASPARVETASKTHAAPGMHVAYWPGMHVTYRHRYARGLLVPQFHQYARGRLLSREGSIHLQGSAPEGSQSAHRPRRPAPRRWPTLVLRRCDRGRKHFRHHPRRRGHFRSAVPSCNWPSTGWPCVETCHSQRLVHILAWLGMTAWQRDGNSAAVSPRRGADPPAGWPAIEPPGAPARVAPAYAKAGKKCDLDRRCRKPPAHFRRAFCRHRMGFVVRIFARKLRFR
jgi:hypothetical protein